MTSTTASSSTIREAQYKLKFLNKLKKGVNRPATQRFHSVPILKVKAHESNVLIPEPKAKSASAENSAIGKMVNCAFELKDETENDDKFIHPIDQPITLNNGKNLYPNGKTSTSKSRPNSNQVDVTKDMLYLLSISFDNLSNLLKYIWELDLYINVSLSNNSKVKLHVPSITAGLISLKILFSMLSSSSLQSTSRYSYSSNDSGSGGLGLFNIIIIVTMGYYLFTTFNKNHNQSGKEHDNDDNEQSAFNTKNAKTIPRIPDLTVFNKPNTGYKPTEYDIIHRNHIPKPETLNINSPISKGSIDRKVMKKLTENGRDEMLKLFD